MGFVLVTGTGSGVGKTWVTRVLARTLQQRGQRVLAVKPVEVGCDTASSEPEDGILLAQTTGQAAPRSALIRFGPMLPPAMAAGMEAEPVDFDALLLQLEPLRAEADTVLLEGTGGLLTPITWEWNAVELARSLGGCPENLAGGHFKFVAEASSHEAGHSFGLDHQASYDGAGRLTDEYYAGPGDGRAPIMGDSYDATRGVWWAGQSSYSPYEFQDDMNIIARPGNGFGYRPDEHSNGIAGATPLTLSGNQVAGSGVIMIMADTDFFSFTTGAGTVTISAVVPAGINNRSTDAMDSRGSSSATE